MLLCIDYLDAVDLPRSMKLRQNDTLSSKVGDGRGGAGLTLSEACCGGDLIFESGIDLPIGIKPAVLNSALQLRAEIAHFFPGRRAGRIQGGQPVVYR